jgi:hypothetical protein
VAAALLLLPLASAVIAAAAAYVANGFWEAVLAVFFVAYISRENSERRSKLPRVMTR